MEKLYKLTKIFINVILAFITLLIPIVISVLPMLIWLQTKNDNIINWLIFSLPIATILAFYMWPGGKVFKIIDNYIEQNKILGQNKKWNEI